VRALMAEIMAAPPEFTDLVIVDESAP
jgi:hypothetical protein